MGTAGMGAGAVVVPVPASIPVVVPVGMMPTGLAAGITPDPSGVQWGVGGS